MLTAIGVGAVTAEADGDGDAAGVVVVPHAASRASARTAETVETTRFIGVLPFRE
jgi:hypothetical protein